MWRFPALGNLLVALLLFGSGSAFAAGTPLHVLFIGNSLIYTGNLPAVLDALAAANGHPLQSQMLVKAGATLIDRVQDGSAAEVMSRQKFDYVFLQERGGDVICHSDPIPCKDSETATLALAALAREHGAKPVMLGTYQPRREASDHLLQAETALAKKAAIPLVAVTPYFVAGRNHSPQLEWFYADDLHPGADLILLEAALVYRHLYGLLPRSADLTVTATIYSPRTKFSPPQLASENALAKDAADGHRYSQKEMSAVLAAAAKTATH